MSSDERDPLWETIEQQYNVPGEVPRAAMWERIEQELSADGEAPVIDLAAERHVRRRPIPRVLQWGVAAAAVLVVGFGIGRITAPGPDGSAAIAEATMAETGAAAAANRTLMAAADEHFGRSESLLTMVRADARGGAIDPGTGEWARELLGQTRLLLDVQSGSSPAVAELLEDLELVLVQIVGAAGAESSDADRRRTELALALRGMEDRRVLTRLQTAAPGMVLSGT